MVDGMEKKARGWGRLNIILQGCANLPNRMRRHRGESLGLSRNTKRVLAQRRIRKAERIAHCNQMLVRGVIRTAPVTVQGGGRQYRHVWSVQVPALSFRPLSRTQLGRPGGGLEWGNFRTKFLWKNLASGVLRNQFHL